MADGKIVFLTKIDNTHVEKDLKQLEKKIRQSQESISKNENAKLPLVNQAKDLGARLDAAKASSEMLREEMAAINSAMSPGSAPDDYAAASAELPRVQAALKAQEKEVAVLQKQWDGVNNKIDAYDVKIRAARDSVAANNAKAAELIAQQNSSGAKMQIAFEKAGTAAEKFKKKLLAVSASMLMFRVFSAVLNGIGKYMEKLLKTNEEYTAQLAQLKAALATAFQPIYDFILPGLIAVLKVLTSIVMVVANILSGLFGKTAAQSAKNAKALNEEADAFDKVGGAAKDAGKHLADFDEINTLGSNSDSGGGGGGPGSDLNFDEFDTAQYKAKIDELTVYLSGALLAIGAILTFSGANIPLGIALMAVGAVGLVSVVKENWGKMSDELKGALGVLLVILGGALLALGAVLAFSGANMPLGLALMAAGLLAYAAAASLDWKNIENAMRGPVGKVVAIVSGALLALGAVLAFSGANPGLGIALIAVGAAGLATTAAINWNSIENALRGPLGKVVALASGALLALGLILAFSGANPALGIALIAAGAVGLVTVAAVNWNAIKDKLAGAWEVIKNWFQAEVAPKLTLQYWTQKFSWLGSLFNWINQNIVVPLKNAFESLWEVVSGIFTGEITIGNLGEGIVESVKSIINNLIAKANSMIVNLVNKVNPILQKIKLTEILGKYPFGGINTIYPTPQIPYLAQGAVLPANRPFLAMVGDQKNGTNIEAPLATIQEALANVLAAQGAGDINITFTGDLAQLARVLKPVIDRENGRVGGSLAKGVL